jgi:hypothetical protein
MQLEPTFRRHKGGSVDEGNSKRFFAMLFSLLRSSSQVVEAGSWPLVPHPFLRHLCRHESPSAALGIPCFDVRFRVEKYALVPPYSENKVNR